MAAPDPALADTSIKSGLSFDEAGKLDESVHKSSKALEACNTTKAISAVPYEQRRASNRESGRERGDPAVRTGVLVCKESW